MALGPQSVKAAWAALPLELVVGTIMFAHGLPKLMNASGFAERALGGIPLFIAYLVIAAEVGGGLLLLAGLLVRLGALGHICVMLVAISQAHWANGLMGQGGFEFPLSVLAASLALIIIGPDPLSIDQNIGLPIGSSRDLVFRRESMDVGSPMVKLAGAILILAGITLAGASIPVVRVMIGLPDGFAWIVALIAGVVSVASGVLVISGKPWAYTLVFVMARLYLAASILLLFWVHYTVRGIIAILVSAAMLVALRSARRG